MFKRVNQDLRPNNSKLPLKRRNFQHSNKMDIENIDIRSSMERYVQSIGEGYQKNWGKYEIISSQILSKQDKQKRSKIFLWLLKHVKTNLTLKLRTIEHAIKLIDVYQSKRQEHIKQRSQTRYRNVYPSSEDLILDTITCLNLSCKYNEIYPPSLSQILCLVQSNSTIENVIHNQFTILQILDLNINFAIVSDWYKIINKKQMPNWASLCYLQYNLQTQSKIIAQQITRFIQKMCEDQKNRQSFLQLTRLSQLACNQTTIKLSQAFADYKLKNQISKINLNDASKIKQNN